MNWKELFKRCNELKKPSRQLGNSFKFWVKTIGYPSLSLPDFENSKKTAFLDASDKVMQTFATNKLKCRLKEKGDIDFIAKTRTGCFIVGAAKFITAAGGGQDNQFFNIIDFTEEKSGNATRIAIVDGAVWFKESGRAHKRICQSNGIILSSLLLKEFIESIK